jgi:hypothetical protein
MPLLRQDRLGAFAAIVVALAAVAPAVGAMPADRRIGRQISLGGMLLAAVSAHPLLTAAGLTLATTAALAPDVRAAWYRVPLAGAALGLVLFGSVLPGAPLTAGCGLLGLAALAVAAPVLLPLLPLLALRFAGPELIAVGLAAALACGGAVVLWPSDKTRMAWIAAGQAAIVGVVFGMLSSDSVFTGLFLAVLLVLAQATQQLAKGSGLTGLLASAGSAGLPPVGVFPGLALTILVAGNERPWLLVPLLAAWAAMGWAAVARLPMPRVEASDRWSAAWVPLALALLMGFVLPSPVLAWLHALARDVVG